MANVLEWCATQSGTYVVLPVPSSMVVSRYDIDSSKSGRNQKGKMIRDRVAIKEKVEIKYNLLTGADIKSLTDKFGLVTFYVKYYSPYTNSIRTVKMYSGDKSANVYYGFDPNHPGTSRFLDVPFNLIEV